jgi:prepilin-type processing-associated H-X9-DG protein
METVQAGILSILISLSGWLNDGLKSYEAEKYDDAIKNLTKVIEKDIPQNKYRDVALFYRAKSYEAKKDKKKALADLVVLIQKHPESSLAKESRTFYKKLGGDPKNILPAESPKKVWEQFVDFAKKGDLEGALSISSGKWKELVIEESDNDPKELKREFSRDEIVAGEEKIGNGDKRGTATLELNAGRELIMLDFTLDDKTNTWIISGFREIGRGGRGGKRGNIQNMNTLKQLVLGLIMYADDNGQNLPAKLNDVVEGYLGNQNQILLWVDPEDSKKQIPFIYCPGLNINTGFGKMVVASPKPVKGKREVAFLDGHVEIMSEKEFIQKAKAQKWKIPGSLKKDDIPAETKKKVLSLLAQLGDKDSVARKKAKAELIEMGDSAYPFLEENKNHNDPEIKMTIKEILEGK